jgi:uncharacterized protein
VIVVSDSSPLIGLGDIGKLDLLRALYGSLLVPPDVSEEFTAGQVPRPLPGWVEVREVANRSLVAVLQAEVHRGEAQAIVLAVELQAELVLLDDHHGRRMAAGLGLRHIGVLGILLEAKRRGLLEAIRPLIDDLIVNRSFWVSEDLRRRVLDAAGET